MITFDYLITNPNGLHARPAGDLVKLANSFKSHISIYKDGKSADAKSILNVMALAIREGETIPLIAEGEDEVLAADIIQELLEVRV